MGHRRLGGGNGADTAEIFQHHAGALIAGDIDEIVADYADDAVFITPSGVRHGKGGVREGFTALLQDLPNATWAVPHSDLRRRHPVHRVERRRSNQPVDDGIDTLVFAGDSIRVQTVQ